MVAIKKQKTISVLVTILLDVSMIILSYFFLLIIILASTNSSTLPFDIYKLLMLSPIIIGLHIGAFAIFGIYKIIIKFFGFEDFMRMVIIIVIVNAILTILAAITSALDFKFMNPFLYIAITFMEIILLLLPRAWKRLTGNLKRIIVKKQENTENILILGAGSVGEKVVKDIYKDPKSKQHILGFLDDDPQKLQQMLVGVEVLGTIGELERFLIENKVLEIIVAIKDYPVQKIRKIFDISSKYNVKTRKFSGIEDIDGEHLVITDVNINDLLNRGVIELDNEKIASFIKDEVVLVTGGGGSIGSELCRQISDLDPKCLIIFDIYENNAYDIQQELIRKFKREKRNLNLIVRIGSVYNLKRLEEIFIEFKPTLVFHAAAYKHVPLMEDSPKEAIRTNVIGTYNTAKLSNEYKVKKFILVSSDKAVRSTNVMGATKRFAELVIQEQQGHSEVTKFSAVRFGNVLGSSGSVIPLFAKQIADGGPVTVTHPEITRFFMTIPEAVSLILQTAVYADGGEIFVLDMGKPVKILSLAEKMIRLSGLKPYVDINIVFTGLRPGEKLYEELLVDVNSNNHIKTANNLIFVEKQNNIKMEDLEMDKIKDVFENFDNIETKKFIASVVKSYVPDFCEAKEK